VVVRSAIVPESAVKIDELGQRQTWNGITLLCEPINGRKIYHADAEEKRLPPNIIGLSVDKASAEIDNIVRLISAPTVAKLTGGVPKLLSFPYHKPNAKGYYCNSWSEQDDLSPSSNAIIPGYLTRKRVKEIFSPKSGGGYESDGPWVRHWELRRCKFVSSRAHVRDCVHYILTRSPNPMGRFGDGWSRHIFDAQCSFDCIMQLPHLFGKDKQVDRIGKRRPSALECALPWHACLHLASCSIVSS
jgi:hypothetical protein